MTVLVTGAAGLLGTALVAELRGAGADVVATTRADADLRDMEATEALFARHRPELVYHLAARVHGIGGNAGRAGETFLDNVQLNTAVIEAARRVGARKVVAMGSAAVYGDDVALPMREEHIWQGRPHGSEIGYAHAKRTMLAQLECSRAQWGLDFVFVVSTNLFGPHDRFDVHGGHVIPSLIAKFHRGVRTGEPVTVWGSGRAVRDLVHAADAAAALRIMGERGSGAINLASGTSHSIETIVQTLAEVSGFRGEIRWDRSAPDGQLNRGYDVSRLRALGIGPFRPLRDGLADAYRWYAAHADTARR